MTDVLPKPVPSMNITMREPPPYKASAAELAIGAAVFVLSFFLAQIAGEVGLRMIATFWLGYAIVLGYILLPRQRWRANWYRQAAETMKQDCEKIATDVAQAYAEELRKEYAALYGEAVREREELRAKEVARARGP